MKNTTVQKERDDIKNSFWNPETFVFISVCVYFVCTAIKFIVIIEKQKRVPFEGSPYSLSFSHSLSLLLSLSLFLPLSVSVSLSLTSFLPLCFEFI